MTEKEIGTIRRCYRSDKSSISRICGCYVNEKKEIIAKFNQSLGTMAEQEVDELLGILKKTLTGAVGRNLIEIDFTTQQELQGEEHKLLSELNRTGLSNDELIDQMYAKISESARIKESFLIIMAYDNYDIPGAVSDGADIESTDVFSYVLCSVCPIKLTKPALGYHVNESKFKCVMTDMIVSAPELGFMFPAYEDKCSNIHKALFYTHSVKESNSEFTNTIFGNDAPMPAEVQKQTFTAIINEAIADECSLGIVQTVHEQIEDIIEEHKTKNDDEPLVISKNEVKNVLKDCEVSDEKLNVFEEKFDESFGAEAKISPKNIIDTKKFDVVTPDVTIRVSPGCSDLVETKIIDGIKYILIRANDSVEVNGVNIRIK